MRLTKDFFENKNTLSLSKDLLWKVLVKYTDYGSIKWVINETEAYIEDDEASHSYNWKKTIRNEVMFKEAWHIYVYFTYWLHYCLNIVSEKQWYWSAVLIRSIIPLDWLDFMVKNRNWYWKNIKQISNWPSKVCLSLSIDKSYNWLSIFDNNSEIYIEDIWYKIPKIKKSTRIWISKAKDKKWRFYF